MTGRIKKYLTEIEHEKSIKILWACETGSRAWGFPSTNSDFDVRVIYVHKTDWYLNLTKQKDSIEIMLENNDIDISGWELKKSLSLLRKSNAAVLERIKSPIIYMEDADFINELRFISQLFYSKIATIHHYLSMAKKGLDDLESGNEFKLKKFFYTLRSAIVCKWIIEKEAAPPIEFTKVYNNLSIDRNFIDRIEELITLKSTVTESYLHKGELQLLDFIKLFVDESEAVKDSLPVANGDVNVLDNLFRKYVYKYGGD